MTAKMMPPYIFLKRWVSTVHKNPKNADPSKFRKVVNTFA